jgi:hypothetical protein
MSLNPSQQYPDQFYLMCPQLHIQLGKAAKNIRLVLFFIIKP